MNTFDLILFLIPCLIASGIFMILFVVAENVASRLKIAIWALLLTALLITVNGLEHLACNLFEVGSCKWMGLTMLFPYAVFGLSYKWSRPFRHRVQRAFNFRTNAAESRPA